MEDFLLEKNVELKLFISELLIISDSHFRLVFPTTIMPRYDGINQKTIEPSSFTSKYEYEMNIKAGGYLSNDIDRITCSFPEISIKYSKEKWESEGIIIPNRDLIFDIHLQPKETSEISIVLEKSKINGKDSNICTFSTALSIVPRLDVPINQNDMEFIFLVDCSGSMDCSIGNSSLGTELKSKIEAVRTALGLFIRGLKNNSSFNIIRFGSSWEKLFKTSQSIVNPLLNKQIIILKKQKLLSEEQNYWKLLNILFRNHLQNQELCFY